MGLHDRLSKQHGNGAAARPPSVRPRSPAPCTTQRRPRRAERRSDPYAELKTRIHHAVHREARPGALQARDRRGPRPSACMRAVTEQLALDRTPLTREERRQIVREITDDILGYGPLEPLLRDDSVTEVMVNAYDRIYVERHGKIERTRRGVRRQRAPAADHRQDRLAGRPPRSTRPRRWSTPACPTAAASTRSSRRSSLKGPTLTIRKFSRDPYTMDDLITFGSLTPKAAQFLAACVQGQAERPHLRRYRHRQDDDAERDVGVHARTTSASSRSRTRPSSSSSRST